METAEKGYNLHGFPLKIMNCAKVKPSFQPQNFPEMRIQIYKRKKSVTAMRMERSVLTIGQDFLKTSRRSKQEAMHNTNEVEPRNCW